MKTIMRMTAVVALGGFLALAGEDEIFEDRFEGQLRDGWTFLRPDEGGRRVGQAFLEIRKAPGTIDKARNIVVRPVPADVEHYGAEVTLWHEPMDQYEQAGIAWYADDGHYVKLVVEKVDESLFVVMSGGARIEIEQPLQRLRLIVQEGQVHGEFLPGAEAEGKWRRVGSVKLPTGVEGRIALLCFHGPEQGDRWAKFQEFAILKW